MHREKRVELIQRDKRVVRLDQLRPHEQRLEAADHKENKRTGSVQDADAFVVDRSEPAPQPGGGNGPGQ